MSCEIYTFTGTGNSLAAARDIAALTGASLISIPSVMHLDSISSQADSIGIVFPCYLAQLYGLPLIVDRFVKKLENLESKYLFAVCTYGGFGPVNALPTLKNLCRLIRTRGGRLHGEFSVRLPLNNLDYDHIPVPLSRDHDLMLKKGESKIKALSQRIVRRQPATHKIIKSILDFIMTPLFTLMGPIVLKSLKQHARVPLDSSMSFFELMPLTDISITVNDKCNGCGTCAKLCPVDNIKIIDKKPVWQHKCEICLACDEWCPQKAIHHWTKTPGKDYHHPRISLSDMINQKRG